MNDGDSVLSDNDKSIVMTRALMLERDKLWGTDDVLDEYAGDGLDTYLVDCPQNSLTRLYDFIITEAVKVVSKRSGS